MMRRSITVLGYGEVDVAVRANLSCDVTDTWAKVIHEAVDYDFDPGVRTFTVDPGPVAIDVENEAQRAEEDGEDALGLPLYVRTPDEMLAEWDIHHEGPTPEHWTAKLEWFDEVAGRRYAIYQVEAVPLPEGAIDPDD